MLFETYGQFSIFLAFIWLGMSAFIVYDLLQPKRILYKSIFDFVFFFIVGIIFISFVHNYNMGQLRLYLFIGLAVGILIEKIFFCKTLESFKNMLYNFINKHFAKIKSLYVYNLSKQTTPKNKKEKIRKILKQKNTKQKDKKSTK